MRILEWQFPFVAPPPWPQAPGSGDGGLPYVGDRARPDQGGQAHGHTANPNRERNTTMATVFRKTYTKPLPKEEQPADLDTENDVSFGFGDLSRVLTL